MADKKYECWFCNGVLDQSKAEIEIDKDLDARLQELHMCPRCYEEWQDECWCAPCWNPAKPFKGEFYCLCSGCEANTPSICPYPRKANGSCCEEMKPITKSLFNRRMEAGIY